MEDAFEEASKLYPMPVNPLGFTFEQLSKFGKEEGMPLKDELKQAIQEVDEEVWQKYLKEKEEYEKKWQEEKKKREDAGEILRAFAYSPPSPPIRVFQPRFPHRLSCGETMPRYPLTAVRQPQYDTEVISAVNTPTELRFFQRQLGQMDASGTISAKTCAETNVSQPGQLSNPLEFDLVGAFIVLPENISDEDKMEFTKGLFHFLYSGNRIFHQSPISCIARGGFAQIPQHLWPQDRDEIEKLRSGREGMLMDVKNREYALSEFMVLDRMLKIRSAESFQVRLEWPQGAPRFSEPIRVTVVLDGLLHVPL